MFSGFFFLQGGATGRGILLSSGVPAAVTEIARTGTAAPDGDGVLDAFYTPALNHAGQVAFTADMGGGETGLGLFRGDGATLTQIARSHQAAPDGAGPLNTAGAPLRPA